MNLRRRLSLIVALSGVVIGGSVAAVIGLGTGAPRGAVGGLEVVVLICAVAVVFVCWRALQLSAVPLERVAARARRRQPVMRPGLLTGPVDPEVGLLARALDDSATSLAARQEELEAAQLSFRNAISRLGHVLANTHDREGILDAMVEVALLVVPGDIAIYFRPVGTTQLEASHARGFDVTGLRLGLTGLAGTAAGRGRVTVLGDASSVAEALEVGLDALDGREPRALRGVAAPMRFGGRLVGVLAVYATAAGRAFTDGEVGLLVSLLGQAEVAINNVDLHEQARREALTDGVTGLWNRRQFDIRLREAIASSQRFGEPFGLAMFDLDDFKRINDTWDHLTGDAALVHFAAILRGVTRDVDLVSRWGGEEFALLMPRTAIDAATVVTQRVVDQTRAAPLVKGDERISFTVSAGVAGFPAHGSTANDVLAAADAALAVAKAGGKDRLHRASCSRPAPVGIDPPSEEHHR